ncbi:MAG: hypothetical protein ED559_05060 [Phycisphaera sp.]|nr:MAG: hypothetical protein ED559_05060 [Phycisphaera sp.]
MLVSIKECAGLLSLLRGLCVSMILVQMGNESQTSRQTGRSISSGIAPTLLIAVAVMVLASGGVSSARALGTAGVGLAMTVMQDRVPGSETQPEFVDDQGSDAGIGIALGSVPTGFAFGSPLREMVRGGLADLPPPALVLN